MKKVLHNISLGLLIATMICTFIYPRVCFYLLGLSYLFFIISARIKYVELCEYLNTVLSRASAMPDEVAHRYICNELESFRRLYK